MTANYFREALNANNVLSYLDLRQTHDASDILTTNILASIQSEQPNLYIDY